MRVYEPSGDIEMKPLGIRRMRNMGSSVREYSRDDV